MEWGADPHRVCLADLFDSYNTGLIERFRALGVDLTAHHDMARALAYHTSNKPLFGFAKRHRDQDVKVQNELNIALVHHASDSNEKGVQLCLWAGADPHSAAASLRFPSLGEDDNEADEDDRFLGFTAIYEACRRGDSRILERLNPDPSRDDFDELYSIARFGESHKAADAASASARRWESRPSAVLPVDAPVWRIQTQIARGPKVPV
jgi:ankyrin repeat protein